MRVFAVILLLTVLAAGAYMNRMDSTQNNQVMIEDEVGSTMAAPQKPDIPL